MAPWRLGFFLYAPRVGGAERYVKDLLHGLDRTRFEPVLLYGAWTALDRYLELDTIEHVPVPIRELGARLGAHPHDGVSTGAGSEISPTRLRRLAASLPAAHGLTNRVRALSRAPLFVVNRRIVGAALGAANLDGLHVINGGYPGATSALSACVAARDVGAGPVVLSVCSTAFPRQSPSSIERRIDREVQATVRAVIVPGQVPAAALVERRSFPSEQLVTIPWGVADTVSSSAAEARAAWGVREGGVLFGTLANFTGAKGHAALLDVYYDLSRDRDDIRLVLAGEGPQRSSIMRRAEELGLRDRVAFPGRVDDPRQFCAALDVFVLASDIEGLPYVVLEAMSQRCPVIATDVGAMAEAVVDGATGVLIPPRDLAALRNAIVELVDDALKRHSMGNAGKQLFDARFSVARMLAAHHELYERVLARR